MKISLSLITFSFFWFLLCLYSFSQKDLNLTIFDHYKLRPFYESMIQLGYFNRPLSTIIFICLSIALLLCYLLLIFNKKIVFSIKQLFIFLVLLMLTSLPAQPMFSHDIYNYIFNAKMVLLYNANPHQQVALDFSYDPLLRFMHNVHTPAPYGYGWTALSLMPFALSANSFTKAYLLMKLFTSLLFIGEIWIFYKLAGIIDKQNALKRTLLLTLNPLLLTEVFIISHNDSAMMLPVLASLYLLIYKTNPVKTITAWFLWAFSVTTKYASVVLAPFMLLHKKLDIFTWGGLSMLVILLTRTDQLHSWYLHWGMVLLMLSKRSWAVSLAVLLSIGGLLRYAPFLWFGNWDPPVAIWRWGILLLPLILLVIPKLRKLIEN